ncbi:MAG: 5-formyltetrahydrofolate cyclo-ligase [Thaumarchaeota archaeon]|nr:5-formyltetrahydrofolate cyclo-ligase [Nitrososphaerota archaeon]
MSKADLRQSALKSRRSLARESIRAQSAEVMTVLLGLPEYARAKTVASYSAKKDEVQTSGIIEQALSSGKNVLVPRVDLTSESLSFCEIHSLSELSPGSFGILEPRGSAPSRPLSESEVVLVPVVAWDEKGNRLGYGRGYFDKALKSRGRSLAAGLALESQRFPTIPQDSDDERLDVIITERRIVRMEAK